MHNNVWLPERTSHFNAVSFSHKYGGLSLLSFCRDFLLYIIHTYYDYYCRFILFLWQINYLSTDSLSIKSVKHYLQASYHHNVCNCSLTNNILYIKCRHFHDLNLHKIANACLQCFISYVTALKGKETFWMITTLLVYNLHTLYDFPKIQTHTSFLSLNSTFMWLFAWGSLNAFSLQYKI